MRIKKERDRKNLLFVGRKQGMREVLQWLVDNGGIDDDYIAFILEENFERDRKKFKKYRTI